MRGLVITGLFLLLAGVAVLAYPVFSYTTKDKVLDAGPLEVQTEHEKHVTFPPIAGGAAIVAGIALVVVGSRRRTA
jgi:hypothetical protein